MFKPGLTVLQSLCLSLFLLIFSSSSLAASKPLIFGVHPYLNPAVLIDRFQPLMNYLQEGLQQNIQIRVGTSYADHIQAFSNGEIDFAYFGPAGFITLASQNIKYLPLGRLSFSGVDTFRGAIIVRQDSKLESLQELAGKRFAFGDPNSTLSNLVPKKMLHDAGVNLQDLGGYSNLKNHHNVALAVLLGKYDAGGVKSEVYEEYRQRGLKVLQWMPDIPTHIFVASPKLSAEKTGQLMQLLQTLHKSNQATQILSRIKKGTTEIIPANTSEYQALRDLIYPEVK